MKKHQPKVRHESGEQDVQDLKGREQELLRQEFRLRELEENEQLSAEAGRRLPGLRETIDKAWKHLGIRDYIKLADLIKKIVEIIEAVLRL